MDILLAAPAVLAAICIFVVCGITAATIAGLVLGRYFQG